MGHSKQKIKEEIMAVSTLVKEESTRSVGGIRVSKLPDEIQDTIEEMNLDKDGDGNLDRAELGMVIDILKNTTNNNKLLRNIILVFCLFTFLLTGGVFGASIVAARLSKDITVDPLNGIAYGKGSKSPMQTEDVIIYSNDSTKIVDKTNGELIALKQIILGDGAVKFEVKGYARSPETNQVGLIVEGGSLLFGEEGIVSATGVAEAMLALAFPDAVSSEEGGRRLFFNWDRWTPQKNSNTVTGSSSVPQHILDIIKKASSGC